MGLSLALLVLIFILAPGLVAAERPASNRSNIPYILADDLGYGDVQCLNPTRKIATPRLEAGTLKRVDLPDGSVLQLNASSAIEVDFTADERRVHLVRGELLATVAKNPARPFIVMAGRVSVRAVGTAFGVHLLPDAAVDVLVTEGKVRVEDALEKHSLLPSPADPKTPPVLQAGQRAVVTVSESGAGMAATLSAVGPAEIEAALAWHKRQLEFLSTPLQQIVAEFNRFNRHQLVVVDPRLAERSFGGTFMAGDYETFTRCSKPARAYTPSAGNTKHWSR